MTTEQQRTLQLYKHFITKTTRHILDAHGTPRAALLSFTYHTFPVYKSFILQCQAMCGALKLEVQGPGPVLQCHSLPLMTGLVANQTEWLIAVIPLTGLL